MWRSPNLAFDKDEDEEKLEGWACKLSESLAGAPVQLATELKAVVSPSPSATPGTFSKFAASKGRNGSGASNARTPGRDRYVAE